MHEGTWLPDNNFWQGRNGHRALWIIIHGTACNGPCSAQNVANYFKSLEGTANPASSHYIIGGDGALVSCVDENDSAWGNGAVTVGGGYWWHNLDNPNYWTISIEHCKATVDNSDALTPLQQETSFGLIKRLCQRHGIPPLLATDTGGITGHFSIDPINRAKCPGIYPWDALWKYLHEGSSAKDKQASDEWGESTVTPLPDTSTTIYLAWNALHARGQHVGPLMSVKASVDWNNAPILVYRFAFARAELDGNNRVRWFDARGEIT